MALCLNHRCAYTTQSGTHLHPSTREVEGGRKALSYRAQGQPMLHKTLPQKQNKLESSAMCLGIPNDYLIKKNFLKEKKERKSLISIPRKVVDNCRWRGRTRTEEKDGSALIGRSPASACGGAGCFLLEFFSFMGLTEAVPRHQRLQCNLCCTGVCMGNPPQRSGDKALPPPPRTALHSAQSLPQSLAPAAEGQASTLSITAWAKGVTSQNIISNKSFVYLGKI